MSQFGEKPVIKSVNSKFNNLVTNEKEVYIEILVFHWWRGSIVLMSKPIESLTY